MAFTDGLLAALGEPRPNETELLARDQDGAVIGIDWARMVEEGLVK